MLDRVPGGAPERELVERGKVPEPGRQDERGPADDRMGEPRERSAQRWPREERADPALRDDRRQSAQQRYERRAQQQQWRRHHHQQQVLHHVHLEQQAREGVERRRDGDEQGREAAEKARQAPDREAVGHLTPQHPPPASVDHGEQKQPEHEPGIEGPGSQDRERHVLPALPPLSERRPNARAARRRARGAGAADASSRGTPPAPSPRRGSDSCRTPACCRRPE